VVSERLVALLATPFGRSAAMCSAFMLSFSLHAAELCGVGRQFRSDPTVVATSNVSEPRWKCESAPTNLVTTALRPGEGTFGARRPEGSHTGVDIMLRDYLFTQICIGDTTAMKPSALEVYAVADGIVAYSRRNSAEACPKGRPGCDLFTTGLGQTVIIDHGNGIYSLYAHMAQDRESLRCLPRKFVDGGQILKVKVGDRVKAGDVIGYLGVVGGGLSQYETSSGNAAVVEQTVQLHFEFFAAPSTRTSQGRIEDIVPKPMRGQISPAPFLEPFYR